MKKHISVLSVILLAVIILSSAAPAAALDAGKFEARDVTTYIFSMDDTTTLTLLFNRDLPEIPYINILDYFKFTRTAEFKYEYEKTGDGTYRISNEFGAMTVDTVNDTAVIENSEYFFSAYLYRPEGSDFDFDQFMWGDAYFVGEYSPLSLDFGKYGIDITEKDGYVYFPVSILNDIGAMTYLAAEYIDGCLYFTETMLSPDGYFDRSSVYDMAERREAFAEFTYNELCFQFDNFYGCPSAAPIAPLIEEMGFDKALDAFDDETRLAKQLLKSTSPVDFHLGLVIITKAFFDGGHSIMASDILYEAPRDSELSLLFTDNMRNNTEENWTLANRNLNLCTTLGFAYLNILYSAKENGMKQYEKALEWEDIAYLTICGNTAVFSFEVFDYSVLRPFMQSLEYAKEQGVKNFVIDLTTNGGGVTLYAYFIAMMTNKNTRNATVDLYNYYQNTKNTLKETYKVDLNLDGVYDELDKNLIYDFDFAILTSSYTFSSANALSVYAKDNGIMIIGETSGGGTCAVNTFYTPACETMRVSIFSKFIHQNGEDVDRGAEVDVDLRKPYTGEFDAEIFGTDDPSEFGFYDYDDFYDFEALGRYIDEFYDKGDVNGDGVKNNKDVIALFKYVSENNEYVASYDINSNGKINNKDVIALFKTVSAA